MSTDCAAEAVLALRPSTAWGCTNSTPNPSQLWPHTYWRKGSAASRTHHTTEVSLQTSKGRFQLPFSLVLFSPRQIYSEYIVLLGKNGGSTVRVLEVGYRSVVRCCYFLSVFLTYHLGSFIPHVICKLVRHYFPNRSTERPASQACHPLWSLISSWTSREIAIDTIILALPAISPLLKYSARLTWHSLQVRHSNRSSILPPRAVARALTTSLAKGTSHTIAIVDFDNFNVRHVTLTEADFENTAPHGRYRGVEWAVGTPYGEYPFASVLR